jgi:hypothetical protein
MGKQLSGLMRLIHRRSDFKLVLKKEVFVSSVFFVFYPFQVPLKRLFHVKQFFSERN